MAFNSHSIQAAEEGEFPQTVAPTRVKVTRDELRNTNNSTQMEYWEPMRLAISISGMNAEEPLSLILTPSDSRTVITKDFEHFCQYEYFIEAGKPIQTIDFGDRENISRLSQEIDKQHILEGTWWSAYHLYVYSDSDSFENPAYLAVEIKDDTGHHHYLKAYQFCEFRSKMKLFNAAPKDRTVSISLEASKVNSLRSRLNNPNYGL